MATSRELVMSDIHWDRYFWRAPSFPRLSEEAKAQIVAEFQVEEKRQRDEWAKQYAAYEAREREWERSWEAKAIKIVTFMAVAVLFYLTIQFIPTPIWLLPFLGDDPLTAVHELFDGFLRHVMLPSNLLVRY